MCLAFNIWSSFRENYPNGVGPKIYDLPGVGDLRRDASDARGHAGLG